VGSNKGNMQFGPGTTPIRPPWGQTLLLSALKGPRRVQIGMEALILAQFAAKDLPSGNSFNPAASKSLTTKFLSCLILGLCTFKGFFVHGYF
jgi:hypothetical protein